MTSWDEQFSDQTLSANRVPEANSPSTAGIAPAPPVTPVSVSIAQPVSSVSERRFRALSGLLALPDLVTTRAGLRTAPIAALALVVGLCSVWSGQRALLGFDPGAAAFAVWFAGLFVLVLVCDQADRETPGTVVHATTGTRTRFSSKWVAVIVIGIGVVSFYIWQEAPTAPPTIPASI